MFETQLIVLLYYDANQSSPNKGYPSLNYVENLAIYQYISLGC